MQNAKRCDGANAFRLPHAKAEQPTHHGKGSNSGLKRRNLISVVTPQRERHVLQQGAEDEDQKVAPALAHSIEYHSKRSRDSLHGDDTGPTSAAIVPRGDVAGENRRE